MQVWWPNPKCYIEAQLRELESEVRDLRHDWIVYGIVAGLALVACVVSVVLAVGVWAALPGAAFGNFAARTFRTQRRWVEARTHFRYLCAERLLMALIKRTDE